MTTKHKRNQSTSQKGVNFVRNIVEGQNYIFQEISLENDIGNDGFIEFIENESALGFAIWVQIKSGTSYVKSNGNFVFKADKDHFEYWNSHIMPVVAFIYDPERDYAVWFDITELLELHPDLIINGPYEIEISSVQKFCSATFQEFALHFLEYRNKYRNNLGLAFEKFADQNNERNCMEGISYLFSYHRDRFTSWYYLISCFQNFRHRKILYYLVNMLAHLPGHQDIFWHSQNRISTQTAQKALSFLSERFGRAEVLCMLEVVTDGGGFARGAIGQDVLSIVTYIQDIKNVLETITFDQAVSDDARYWSLLLLVYFEQEGPHLDKCFNHVARFLGSIHDSDSDLIFMAEGIREELKRTGRFDLFC